MSAWLSHVLSHWLRNHLQSKVWPLSSWELQSLSTHHRCYIVYTVNASRQTASRSKLQCAPHEGLQYAADCSRSLYEQQTNRAMSSALLSICQSGLHVARLSPPCGFRATAHQCQEALCCCHLAELEGPGRMISWNACKQSIEGACISTCNQSEVPISSYEWDRLAAESACHVQLLQDAKVLRLEASLQHREEQIENHHAERISALRARRSREVQQKLAYLHR